MASISPRNPGAEAADDVHRDGRPWAGQVPCLLEGGETLTQCLTVHHGDGPVHDVRQARPLAVQDGREVAQRLPGLLRDRGADDVGSQS